MSRRQRDEDGSLSVELAMLAPGLLLIFALIFAYGQTGQVHGTLDSGTRDAARSATVARSYDEAKQNADRAVKRAIKGTPQACQDSLRVTVSTDFTPGQPIVVTATCSYGLSDIGFPGFPGTLHAESSFTSMLDPKPRCRVRRDERGSLAPAVPIIALMLLLLGGLGIDGSRQLNARGQAVAFAEEASRAGAQGVDVNADDLVLDGALARERVAKYCAAVLRLGQVTDCRFVRVEAASPTDPRPLVVVTHVELSVKATLLAMVGVTDLTASADAKARPYEGIDAPLT